MVRTKRRWKASSAHTVRSEPVGFAFEGWGSAFKPGTMNAELEVKRSKQKRSKHLTPLIVTAMILT